MPPRRSAFFLPVEGGGSRFCVVTEPAGEAIGAVLYVHPLAEEMNKSRRMAALAAAAFAARGWRVLQVDLGGCGDSSGDFGDASWAGWIADVQAAWQWLRDRAPGPIWVWGLRAGALLVCDWLATAAAAPPLLFWQPVVSGRQHLTQFLRLKGASQMLEDSDARAAMAAARAALEAGDAVEVAGYALAPALARGLESAQLRLPERYPAPVAALEVAAAERCEVTPALRAVDAKWQAAGVRAAVSAVAGKAFWQTQEIETCPALIDASVAALGELYR